jgi:class 3 adenylate cyclase
LSELQKPDLKAIEPYDISYAELRPEGDWQETIQKIATAINVQFAGSSEPLPFVPSRHFAGLLREPRVFLVGPSGSGKSRTIIELLRGKTPAYERVFVINPSNPAGLQSGRENIAKLSRRFGQGDLVIWDNFPDGLVKRDLESAFGALEVVNAAPIQNLYIALKPSYLEIFRGLTTGIPDIYTHEVSTDLDTMKALVKAYGGVGQFRDVSKLVSANLDKIARILWKKQPLSLTVVDYYKALATKAEAEPGALDEPAALQMASAWLPVYDYFERQFEVMKSMPARRGDVEFLYVLRFCYEAGLDRTPALVASLQKGIFGSDPPAEQARQLGTWVYLSGQNYAMHDSAKSGIRLPEYAIMKIASYLVSNFSDLVLPGKSDGELHPLGLFIGRNLEFMSGSMQDQPAIPQQIYEFMKKKAVFEQAIGRGVGENFERLDESLQQRILDFVDTELVFGVGVADSLGERFIDLDDSNRKRLIEKTNQGMLFARYFGQSVGRLYSRLPAELRALITDHTQRNPQFADGLGMGLGYAYTSLDPPLQREVVEKAETNFEIARGVGFGFGLTIGLLPEKNVREIMALADSSSELDTGFGMGIAISYPGLPDRLRRYVLDRVATDCEFGFGVGIYSAFFYKEACPPDIFGLLEKNTEVAYGLGLGYGPLLFYLPEKFRSDLDMMLKDNPKLDEGLGSGIGLVLKHFPAQAQGMFFDKASRKNAFASGLGYGVGYTWQYLGEELRKRAIAVAGSNTEFARGMGMGFGCHLNYLSELLDRATELADSNSELDKGLGGGAAWAWPYFGESAKRRASLRIASSTQFAKGFGFGLARVVKQLSASERHRFLDMLAIDPYFAEGFGEGIGEYVWTTYDMHAKEKFLSQAAASAELAQGVGAGIGMRYYSYFESEFAGGTLQAFLKKDPDLMRGLGLGTSYNHIEANDWRVAASRIGNNGFTNGLGAGLGSIFPFISNDARTTVIMQAANNVQLSIGLGFGLGQNITYLPAKMEASLFEFAKENDSLAAGLGKGCGFAFAKLSENADRLQALKSGLNPDSFAFGFGFGVGAIRKYLSASDFGRAAAAVGGSQKFFEGFAAGVGNAAPHIPNHQLVEIMTQFGSDRAFAKAFGFGLGHVVSLLAEETRLEIFSAMKDSNEFFAGLGEGIGHYLPVTGSQFVEDAMRSYSSPSLNAGIASGIAESFAELDMVEVVGLLEYAAGAEREFAEAFGRRLAERFSLIDPDVQRQIVSSLARDTPFSREFKAAGGSLDYVSPELKEKINELRAGLPDQKSALEPEARTSDLWFALFPVSGLSAPAGREDWAVAASEISFSGEVKNYCVCFIDIIASTRISSELSPARLSRYYELFLNSIATIARNFGARIVKNAGDALIFYFEKTGDETNIAGFRNVLDCGLTMASASNTLNAIMLAEKLPPISYRISAEYGQVALAKSQSSQSQDLFGPAMNVSAKINSMARPNGLVIGAKLFDRVGGLSEYRFSRADDGQPSKGQLAAYHVQPSEPFGVINPFERKSRE